MTTSTTLKSAAALQKLLSPISQEEFFERYFEKKLLHISREDPDYYKRLLSKDELDGYLCRHDLPVDMLKLAKEGRTLPGHSYALNNSNAPGAIADIHRCFNMFEEGASFVLQKCHLSFPNIGKLCTSLASFFKFFIQANIYITPPSSQGFNVHPDFYDVFVLQITGSKKWKIYDYDIPLPQMSNIGNDFRPGPLSREIMLNEGDLLYLPRGVLHAAETTDTYSTHITIGLSGMLRWIDYFRQALEQMGDELAFREAVPTWSEDEFQAMLPRKLEELKTLIGSEINWEKQYAQHTARAAGLTGAKKQTVSRGYFKALTEIKNEARDFTFRRVPGSHATLTENENGLALTINGKVLNLPGLLQSPLAFMLDSDAFTIEDIPGGIDRETRHFLCLQLVKSGLFVAGN